MKDQVRSSYIFTVAQIPIWILISVGIIVTLFGCSSKGAEENSKQSEPVTLQLDQLVLPDGFKIDVFAKDVTGARSMTQGRDGIIFVGTREAGNVYALLDENSDGRADKKYVLDSGLRAPNGVAYRNGDLYVAEVSKLWRYEKIEQDLANPPEPNLIYDDYPKDYHHGWKYIAFGPDNKLYVPVGAPCNNCESRNELYASITRMNADGSNREVFAKGVRNTVGFTWHPQTGDMWFTDNGRDMLGDDIPPCELNKVSQPGQHFGYPYCHGGVVKDPEFGDKFACEEFVKPEHNLDAHVAPLGIKFYEGQAFPESYRGNAFIAEHGSWNRSSKIGYRITMVTMENNEATGRETFISGWLDETSQEAWGRPVDLLILKDGSMLISDDHSGTIYRVSYKG